MAWYPLFAHARTIPEIFRELVRLWTSYMWLLCGEITKLDIWLAVWQLCLLGDGFHIYQRLHDKDYATTTASSTVTVLVVEINSSLVADRPSQIPWVATGIPS